MTGATTTPWRKVPVVALVCSSGGLDAVTRILGELPRDFAAAVIVLRHHDPHAPNRLAHILGRQTALSVVPASDGNRLVAGRVFVAPAGHHTLVTNDDTFTLIVHDAVRDHQP